MDKYQFFKYRSVNKRLIESIVDSSLHFARPNRLNDPFDCQVDIAKAARYAASRSSGQKRQILETMCESKVFFDDIQTRMRNVGVCSFSLTLEEPLLWSHYGDEHRGVCLLYEFSEEFLVDRTNEIVGVTDITYGENPLSDWFIENIPDDIDENFYQDFPRELLKRVLLVKGSGWSYEKEYRIIRENEGLFTIPKEYLKQVCFGLNTSEADKRLIRTLVDSSGYNVSYCEIRKLETDFGIAAVEIE